MSKASQQAKPLACSEFHSVSVPAGSCEGTGAGPATGAQATELASKPAFAQLCSEFHQQPSQSNTNLLSCVLTRLAWRTNSLGLFGLLLAWLFGFLAGRCVCGQVQCLRA